MHPPRADTVVVRYSGEIGVKSKAVQSRMEEVLRDNIGTMLAERDFSDPVESEHTRLYVRTAPERIDEVTDVVTDAFGVVSASPAVEVEPTMDDICDALDQTAFEWYGSGTFAVRARRAGDESAHPFSSTDVERRGGDAVWRAAEKRGVDPVVDLEDPDHTFHVECRPDRAFVFLRKQPGPGGLPLGTQEPVVALVSGGIDSPVAAWLMMKRGCPVYPLYVDLGDYGGIDHRLRAEETVGRLARHVPGGFDLRVVPGGEGFDRIVGSTETCRMLVARRFMLMIAERVADSLDAVGIVTGESVGQKSSQTSASLGATSPAVDLPVHRPLLSMDKEEIIGRAREIGTSEGANIDAGCNRLVPETPATRPPLSTVRDAEPDAIGQLARGAVDRVEVVSLPAVTE
ncbi:tRNA 4-thiouridine(8) synthase ThiI [Halobacteriales archaeon QH_2_65_14]|nr:MAG: tRNA 4-thiouridine(8) synthase ThiI [Halobacteriales archaeon QH_2_65_14]